jgi:hypothetical protein
MLAWAAKQLLIEEGEDVSDPQMPPAVAEEVSASEEIRPVL